LKSSAKASPAPIEFPDWKEAVTRKIPVPVKYDNFLPYFLFMILIRVISDDTPIFEAMDVKMTIKKVDMITIQSNLNWKEAPSFDAIVRLPGPKTRAAVIIPGPKYLKKDRKPFFPLFLRVFMKSGHS
jgi:hypothetical protein